jgi:hypothetical protein
MSGNSPGRKQQKYRYCSFRVSEELWRALHEESLRRGCSESQIMRMALISFLFRTENFPAYLLRRFARLHEKGVNLLDSLRSYLHESSGLMDGVRMWVSESGISEREAEVFLSRYASVPLKTLEALGRELGVSRERVRQLEEKAVKTLLRRRRDGGRRKVQADNYPG